MRRPDPDTLRKSIDSAISALEQARKLAPGLLDDARSFDRGFSGQALGGGGSGNYGSSSVETAVAKVDLSGRIDEWLVELDETVAHAIRLGSKAARLAAHGREDRKNQAAICQVCGEPGVTWARGLCDECRGRWDVDRATGSTLDLTSWKLAEHRKLFPDRKQPFGVDAFEDAELKATHRRAG